jgi:hypothetical protein
MGKCIEQRIFKRSTSDQETNEKNFNILSQKGHENQNNIVISSHPRQTG